MAYLLSNVYTKNYWNRTTTVEIILGGWVVSFFRHSVVFWCHVDEILIWLQLIEALNLYGVPIWKICNFSQNLLSK